MPAYLSPRGGISLSAAITEARASASANIVEYETIELSHPLIVDEAGAPTAIRVVNGLTNISATIEGGAVVEFVALPFELTLPEESEGPAGTMRLSIDNVSRLIWRHIRATKGSAAPIVCIFRSYTSDDLTAPHQTPTFRLYLSSPQATLTRVTATATLANLTNRAWPSLTYTRVRVPALAAAT